MMRKTIPMTRDLIFRGFVGFLLLLLLVTPAVAQLTYEQQQALTDYFNKNDKIASFGSKPLELLDNQKYANFFKQYGNALLVIRVANELKNTNDLEAAKMIVEALEKRILEKIAPSFSKVLGWIGWAKLGMELFKEFYFDPALEQFNVDMYIKNRSAFGPEDCFATVRAWGHVRLRALKRFRAEYGSLVFKPGSKDELLPKWEKKLQEFANAWFETQYQKKLLEDAKQALLKERQQAEGKLPDFDQYLLTLLQEKQEGAITQSIVILLDASGSMKEDNRMAQAKASVRSRLKKLTKETEVALIVFYDCGSIVVEQEFTTDTKRILDILPKIQPSGDTPLAAATKFAKTYLKQNARAKRRRLVILTDGKETCGGDPVSAARE